MKRRIKAASSIGSDQSSQQVLLGFSTVSFQSFYYFRKYQYDESGERPRGVRAAGLARSLLARHAPVVLGRLADRQYALANLRRLLENRRPATWA